MLVDSTIRVGKGDIVSANKLGADAVAVSSSGVADIPEERPAHAIKKNMRNIEDRIDKRSDVLITTPLWYFNDDIMKTYPHSCKYKNLPKTHFTDLEELTP